MESRIDENCIGQDEPNFEAMLFIERGTENKKQWLQKLLTPTSRGFKV